MASAWTLSSDTSVNPASSMASPTHADQMVDSLGRGRLLSSISTAAAGPDPTASSEAIKAPVASTAQPERHTNGHTRRSRALYGFCKRSCPQVAPRSTPVCGVVEPSPRS